MTEPGARPPEQSVSVFGPGARITRYEVLHDRVWLSCPVTVVSDDGHELAVVLEPGTPLTEHEHPHGPHPWRAYAAWRGPTVLQVHRSEDRYGVWRFFDPVDGPDGPAWSFRRWYLNFEAPITRFDDGYGTDDHGLDLVVHPDGRREWKDVADLHHQRAEGRISQETVALVLEEAARVVDLLDADDRWWSRWDDWTPGAAAPA